MTVIDDHTSNDAYHAACAYFLGPKSENAGAARRGFSEIVNHWIEWRTRLFPEADYWPGDCQNPPEDSLTLRYGLQSQLEQLCAAFGDETPTYTPRYFGHMVSEISLPALFGHFLALLHNPNNTSKDVSKVGCRLESEAIAMLAKMVGLDPDLAEGHLNVQWCAIIAVCKQN